MSVIRFTDSQVDELRKNPYVKNVSNKAITYNESFKQHFIQEYQSGKRPSIIFEEAGFDIQTLGKKRIKCFTDRVKAQYNRYCGFEDQRKYTSGRPKTKDLTPEEKILKLEIKNKLLTQENDFLKRVRYINKKQISKQSKV